MRKLFSSIEINNCRFIGTLDIGMIYLISFIALIVLHATLTFRTL